MKNMRGGFCYIIVFLSLLLFLFPGLNLMAQSQSLKILKAFRVQKPPKVDGNPGDVQWQKAESATSFLMFNPGDGDPLPVEFDTKVKVVYDDTGLYILALMNDPQPDKITRRFGLRDQPIQSDHFSVVLNPFSTPNNNYVFTVFASGSQMDSNDPNGKDLSWNAVWKSHTAVTNQGWVVEMFIPYSALRFQNEKEQTWSIGFFRHIDRTREDYSWTYIDKTKTGDMVQFLGKLTGLKDLKPPVRLSLYPYTSVVHNRYKSDNNTDFGFGMDLKYGLSENYTLDATLIPDFSDTPFDELQLNLGPFEQYYQEKRQFFTEGFDLFNKGRLFYSRRVGGRPSGYYDVAYQLNQNEILEENPEKTPLLNALKISGRNKNGLGIGFFNAVTGKTEATVKNEQTGKERKIVTEPLANYNIMVMDYNFKGNSSISLINTNVLRQGSFRDANVTGLSLNLYGFNNTLNIIAVTAMSLINEKEQYTKGFKYIFIGSKVLKNHTFKVFVRTYDTHFDSNDLGFNRHNNFANFDVSYKYKILKPTKHFNAIHISFDAGFDHLYEKLQKVQNDYELTAFFTNKKYLSYGFGLEYVTDAFDYYEPRTPGRYFLDKAHGGFWMLVSTDYRKRLAGDIRIARYTKFNDPQNFYSITFSPRFRFSNRFNAVYKFEYQKMTDGKGFVDKMNNQIIFGNRQQRTVINSLGANYFFSTKSAVNLNFRYYWSPVYYDKFYNLNTDGTLTPVDTYDKNKDINYNVWNMDVGYSWEFAPGSNLSFLYRNSLLNFNQDAKIDFNTNFNNLMEQPGQNTFILKMTYYIDYNTVKNKWF